MSKCLLRSVELSVQMLEVWITGKWTLQILESRWVTGEVSYWTLLSVKGYLAGRRGGNANWLSTLPPIIASADFAPRQVELHIQYCSCNHHAPEYEGAIQDTYGKCPLRPLYHITANKKKEKKKKERDAHSSGSSYMKQLPVLNCLIIESVSVTRIPHAPSKWACNF